MDENVHCWRLVKNVCTDYLYLSVRTFLAVLFIIIINTITPRIATRRTSNRNSLLCIHFGSLLWLVKAQLTLQYHYKQFAHSKILYWTKTVNNKSISLKIKLKFMLILVHGGSDGGIHGKVLMMKKLFAILLYKLFLFKLINVSLRP